MPELTPIPADQRQAYLSALVVGRQEAERLGYGLIDDRIFGAFHRALYSPMLHAHAREVRAKVAEEIATDILARHAKIGLRPTPWADGYTLASQYAAAVARQHAVQPAETAVGAISAPPAIGGKHDEEHATGGVYTGPPIPLGTHGCVLEPTDRDARQER